MRAWMVLPVLVGALIVLAAWLLWPRQAAPEVQHPEPSAKLEPDKTPAPPPVAESAPEPEPEEAPPETTEEPPTEDTLAEFLEAIAVIKQEAVGHNRLGAAYGLAARLREQAAEHLEVLHEMILRIESDTALSRAHRANIVQALVLALPDDAFEPLVAEIRSRWMLASMSDDRRKAIDSHADKPIAERFYRVLPPADAPLAGALGHAIAGSLGHQEVDRTRSLLDAVFGPFLATEGAGFSEAEFPDVWLSEVVHRLDFRVEWRFDTTWPLAEQSLRAVALNHEFTERLRYQARMIVLPSSMTITEVLAEIEAATSPLEAGQALARFLTHSTLTPDDLLKVLAAMRAANFPETQQDPSRVYDIVFRFTDRLADEAGLMEFAQVVMDTILRDDLSNFEYWQLSRLLNTTRIRRSNYRAILRGSTGSTHTPPMYSGPDTARAIEAIRKLIAVIADEDAEFANEDEHKFGFRSFMAGHITGDILQLDVTGQERIELMRELLTAIGGTSYRIAATVMRHAYLQQNRSMRAGSFTDYWTGMLRLFLEMYTPEEPFRPQSDLPLARLDSGSLNLVHFIHLLHKETPSVVLTPAESRVLRKIMKHAAEMAEEFPTMGGSEDGVKAIEYLNQSGMLTDRT
jgi:hypothetical protein